MTFSLALHRTYYILIQFVTLRKYHKISLLDFIPNFSRDKYTVSLLSENVKFRLSKGLSINDVFSEGEGGGPPLKPIYYISLFSNLSRQGEGGGS